MTPEKGNAPLTLAGERGANTKQRGIAGVSVTHTSLLDQIGPFDPAALALATMAVEDQDRAQGMTTDDVAVAELLAAGVPVEVSDMAVIDGKVVTHWALCWSGFLRSEDAEQWLEQFIDGLDEIRVQATGADRLALERLDFYFTDPQYRSAATRACLPTSAEFSAIVARTLKETDHAHRH
jgi:hypothetical protein